tara:strand:+ start:664 stop:864 length:201 start_codon:yes stop_codon:yes gene_type:complete
MMTSLFTDPLAALEEAEYLAKDTQVSHCLVQVTPEGIQVMPKREARLIEALILETVTPEYNFSIYD